MKYSRQLTASKQRFKVYNSQEVKHIIRSIMEPKIQYFQRQLQQKQRIIRELNQRLNQNDIKLNQLNGSLQNAKRNKSIVYQNQIAQIVNQMLNEKIKSHQDILSRHLHKLKNQVQLKMNNKQRQNVQEMQRLRRIVDDAIQSYRNRSNSYWGSIKEALNKINSRIIKNQHNLDSTSKSFTTNQENSLILEQIQKNKRFLKKFGQFKKAVIGMQKAYNETVKLSKQVKQHANNSKIDQSTPLQYSKDEHSMKIDHSTTHLLNVQYSPIKNKEEEIQTQRFPQRQMKTRSFNKKDASMISINSNNQIHCTTLVNLSMQSRREMAENIKHRLIEMIEVKNIQVPIACYIDQINYLKNAEGNYIFDMKGNMFKINKETFVALCEQGILQKTQNLNQSRSRSLKKHHIA